MTKKELKNILINARKEKHLTHEQVALKSGITRQYYGMIENVDRTPTVDVAKPVAEVLDIDWTIFFEVKSNKKLQKAI
jgi:transcriptional regulator with XRE-family HTH domain